jgi:hypothetical protein
VQFWPAVWRRRWNLQIDESGSSSTVLWIASIGDDEVTQVRLLVRGRKNFAADIQSNLYEFRAIRDYRNRTPKAVAGKIHPIGCRRIGCALATLVSHTIVATSLSYKSILSRKASAPILSAKSRLSWSDEADTIRSLLALRTFF